MPPAFKRESVTVAWWLFSQAGPVTQSQSGKCECKAIFHQSWRVVSKNEHNGRWLSSVTAARAMPWAQDTVHATTVTVHSPHTDGEDPSPLEWYYCAFPCANLSYTPSQDGYSAQHPVGIFNWYLVSQVLMSLSQQQKPRKYHCGREWKQEGVVGPT